MSEDSVIATVGDLITHLQRNFRPEDKLCFWDDGGAGRAVLPAIPAAVFSLPLRHHGR